jgi:hypothetical protein
LRGEGFVGIFGGCGSTANEDDGLWGIFVGCFQLRLKFTVGERRKVGFGEVCFAGSLPKRSVSYGPPWAHYLGGYQDRLLGGPLGLPSLRCTTPDGVNHKDYGGEVLG